MADIDWTPLARAAYVENMAPIDGSRYGRDEEAARRRWDWIGTKPWGTQVRAHWGDVAEAVITEWKRLNG